MKILWYEFKKATDWISKKSIYGYQKNWFEFIGNSLNSCWEVVITLNSFYQIQKFCAEAQAYKTKIINWIGKKWVYLEDENWKIIEDNKTLNLILDTFKDNTWQSFKDKYFTNNFCSWDIYLYPRKSMDWTITAQVIDSRIVKKIADEFWTILRYEIRWKKTINKTTDELYNSITRYDPDSPINWMSLYQSILYDSLSDSETSKRNFYFFKNNAVPNAVFMLDPNITDPDQQKIASDKIKEKFAGSENSSKFLVTWWIQDVKTLDVSNRDLELLWMRDFFIKKMGIIFQIDPRLIGYVNDVWSYASIREIRKEAQETLKGMSNQFEDDLNNFYKQFVDPKFKYYIRVNSETLDDREFIEENQRKDIELWLTTVGKVWLERWYDTSSLPENANKPLIKSSLTTLDLIWTI